MKNEKPNVGLAGIIQPGFAPSTPASHGDRNGLKLGLLLTILLGLLFSSVQAYEYIHAPFAFKGNIYGATFFMATLSSARPHTAS